MSSIEATLTASQLRWTGHIIRMNDNDNQRLYSVENCRRETSSWWATAAIQRCSQTTRKGYTHHRRQPLQKIDNSGGRPYTQENATLKKRYNKNTNTITISAMAFLILLPLSSSVSTAGEDLNLKLDYSLTNEQSM